MDSYKEFDKDRMTTRIWEKIYSNLICEEMSECSSYLRKSVLLSDFAPNVQCHLNFLSFFNSVALAKVPEKEHNIKRNMTCAKVEDINLLYPYMEQQDPFSYTYSREKKD